MVVGWSKIIPLSQQYFVNCIVGKEYNWMSTHEVPRYFAWSPQQVWKCHLFNRHEIAIFDRQIYIENNEIVTFLSSTIADDIRL